MSDDVIRRSDAIKAMAKAIGRILYDAEAVSQHVMNSIPAAEPKQGEWIDKAISIIDDMRSEGIVDYEQASEFRMRARMKGTDECSSK